MSTSNETKPIAQGTVVRVSEDSIRVYRDDTDALFDVDRNDGDFKPGDRIRLTLEIKEL